jgi:methyl-accepting chemotaxis protein
MSELTPVQIRESRDKLLGTIDKLNDLLLDKGTELAADEIKEIRRAIRQLSNAVAELTAKAIEGTARDLEKAVKGINKATHNANDAMDKLQDTRNVINIATALVGLGTAIASGNPAGIVSASESVLKSLSTAVRKSGKIKDKRIKRT